MTDDAKRGSNHICAWPACGSPCPQKLHSNVYVARNMPKAVQVLKKNVEKCMATRLVWSSDSSRRTGPCLVRVVAESISHKKEYLNTCGTGSRFFPLFPVRSQFQM